jgi:hypothetical protein
MHYHRNPAGLRELQLCVCGRGVGLVPNIPGVQGVDRFEANDPRFLVRARPMLHASRHDDTLSGLQLDGMIPELHPELAFPDHKELVFVVVMVPGELAAHLDDLDVLPVEGGDDLRAPVLVEEGEFFIKGYAVHMFHRQARPYVR